MQDIDINRYFSIDKPISIPQIPKQNSVDYAKQTKTHFPINDHDDTNEQELNKYKIEIYQ
jgi:hypothetical protein